MLHTHLPHADFLGLGASLRMRGLRRFSTLHNIWYKWDWRDHAVFAAYRVLYGAVAPDTEVIAISASVAWHAKADLACLRRECTCSAMPFLRSSRCQSVAWLEENSDSAPRILPCSSSAG